MFFFSYFYIISYFFKGDQKKNMETRTDRILYSYV
jgi:hypothetical protein